MTPGINGLTHNAIVLAISALRGLATLCLPEVDDGDHRILGVDLNLVENVGVAHWVSPSVDELIIGHGADQGSGDVPLPELVTRSP